MAEDAVPLARRLEAEEDGVGAGERGEPVSGSPSSRASRIRRSSSTTSGSAYWRGPSPSTNSPRLTSPRSSIRAKAGATSLQRTALSALDEARETTPQRARRRRAQASARSPGPSSGPRTDGAERSDQRPERTCEVETGERDAEPEAEATRASAARSAGREGARQKDVARGRGRGRGSLGAEELPKAVKAVPGHEPREEKLPERPTSASGCYGRATRRGRRGTTPPRGRAPRGERGPPERRPRPVAAHPAGRIVLRRERRGSSAPSGAPSPRRGATRAGPGRRGRRERRAPARRDAQGEPMPPTRLPGAPAPAAGRRRVRPRRAREPRPRHGALPPGDERRRTDAGTGRISPRRIESVFRRIASARRAPANRRSPAAPPSRPATTSASSRSRSRESRTVVLAEPVAAPRPRPPSPARASRRTRGRAGPVLPRERPRRERLPERALLGRDEPLLARHLHPQNRPRPRAPRSTRPRPRATLQGLRRGQVSIFHYSEEQLLGRPGHSARRQARRVGAGRLGGLGPETVVEALAEDLAEKGAVRGDGVEVPLGARGVPLVHVDGDELEEERGGRGRRARAAARGTARPPPSPSARGGREAGPSPRGRSGSRGRSRRRRGSRGGSGSSGGGRAP